MASNHVHLETPTLGQADPHNNNAFVDNDLAGFNASLFSNGQAQPFDGWNLDPNHLAAQRSHSASLPQQWQGSGPISRPLSAVNSGFDVDNNFYGRGFSNSPAPYHDAFNNPGLSYPNTAALDPALALNHPNFLSPYSTSSNQAGTVSPHALQGSSLPVGQKSNGSVTKDVPKPGPESSVQLQATANGSAQTAGTGSTTLLEAPKGKISGDFVIVEFEALCQATKSHRLHNFVNIADFTYDLPITKTTIPQYVPRKSRTDLKILAAGDKRLLARISKKPSKKAKASDRGRGRPPKSAVPTSKELTKEEPADTTSETDTSDDSDYDSSDSEYETPEPSPLPSSRPSEPLPAVRYDTIKAVWHSRKFPATAEKIRTGLGEFWEVVRTIRDRWKIDSQAVKQAEEAKKLSELPLLKDRVKSQRDMMEMALRSALEHGHPDILGLFGENHALIFLLYQFLADRAREREFDTPLSNTALELLIRCTTLTTETLEKTKIDKVLNLYGKKGNEATKAKIKQILDKAAAAKKPAGQSPSAEKPRAEKSEKGEKVPEGKEKEVKPQPQAIRKPAPEPAAGVKRPRSGDAPIGQPAKKLAGSSTTAPSAAARSATTSATLKRPGSAAAEKQNGTLAAVKTTKTQPAVTKPTSFFSSLTSASKKPGTSNTGAAAKSGVQKKPVAAPAKPAFSFAETMANLTRPKEPEPTKKEEVQLPPETEEERAKRLRKEERRKLRVSWKPDASLVSIRLFTHDPEEEIGHDPTRLRDASDVGSEGRMFKQHMEMTLDEDEDLPREENYRDWREPTLVDFTSVPEEERQRNYAPYGGGVQQPVSPDRDELTRRESTTLMVFYSHPSDIPPSPREPPEIPDEEAKPPVEFGKPDDQTLKRSAALLPSQPQPTPTVDISSILSMIGGAQQQPQQATQPQAPSSSLEQIFANFSQAPQSAPQMAAQPPVVAPTAPTQQTPAIDVSAILSTLQQQTGLQQQQQSSQPLSQPPMSAFPQAYPATTAAPGGVDLNSLFATLGQQGIQIPQMPGYPYPGQPLPQQQQQQQQQQRQSFDNNTHQNNSHKRFRDNDDVGGGPGAWKKNKKGGGGGFNNYSKFKTQPCRFWKSGTCKKGDDCPYIHDNN